MATMRQALHEMLKAKWIEIIIEHSKTVMAVRTWCEVNQISSAGFFYWSRVIRQDSTGISLESTSTPERVRLTKI